MLVLPHFFSWAHVTQLFSQQPPKSQLTFLQLFVEELWNHFDVVFCHTRYMMSASFWQHHSCIYPNTLIPSNSSKYWRLLQITVDNIVIFTVKHYMFPKLIAINRDLTAQYFFFSVCHVCVCLCVCVISRLVYTAYLLSQHCKWAVTLWHRTSIKHGQGQLMSLRAPSCALLLHTSVEQFQQTF